MEGENSSLFWIKEQVSNENYRLTLHAQVALVEDGYRVADLLTGMDSAILVEDYPEARRGPCCLVLR